MKIARFSHQDAIRYGIVDEGELVVLAADPLFAAQPVRGFRQGPVRVSPLLALTGAHEPLARQGLLHGDHRLQWLVFHLGQPGRLAGGVVAGGGDGEQWLADVFHVFAGQERIPREHRANVQMARYVRRRHHRDHPRIGGHGGQVHG